MSVVQEADSAVLPNLRKGFPNETGACLFQSSTLLYSHLIVKANLSMGLFRDHNGETDKKPFQATADFLRRQA